MFSGGISTPRVTIFLCLKVVVVSLAPSVDEGAALPILRVVEETKVVGETGTTLRRLLTNVRCNVKGYVNVMSCLKVRIEQ